MLRVTETTSKILLRAKTLREFAFGRDFLDKELSRKRNWSSVTYKTLQQLFMKLIFFTTRNSLRNLSVKKPVDKPVKVYGTGMGLEYMGPD